MDMDRNHTATQALRAQKVTVIVRAEMVRADPSTPMTAQEQSRMLVAVAVPMCLCRSKVPVVVSWMVIISCGSVDMTRVVVTVAVTVSPAKMYSVVVPMWFLNGRASTRLSENESTNPCSACTGTLTLTSPSFAGLT